MGSLVLKSYLRNPLALAPSAIALELPQSRKFSDPRSHRNGFDLRDRSDDCEMPGGILPDRDCANIHASVLKFTSEKDIPKPLRSAVDQPETGSEVQQHDGIAKSQCVTKSTVQENVHVDCVWLD